MPVRESLCILGNYRFDDSQSDMPFADATNSQLLGRSLLCSRLNESQLTRLGQSAVRVRLAENEILFEQGDPAKRFYLVVSGQIKLYRMSPSGTEKIIEIVTSGHTFAEALMFMDFPIYPVSASALQPATLISVDAHDFRSILRDSLDTCFLIMGDMSQRLRGLVQEIDDLTLQSATCRVAGYFLNASRAGGNALALDLPKQVLASRLSVTPETFSRILRKLSDQGIIAVERDIVHIQDPERLSAAAEQCHL